MNCPFCGKEMRAGTIPVYGESVRWVSKDDEEEKIPLSRGTMWRFSERSAEAHYCPDCRQIIVPVPEKIETFSDKMTKKMAELSAKVDKAQEKWEHRRSEKKEEQKWTKRRGKDPWEW